MVLFVLVINCYFTLGSTRFRQLLEFLWGLTQLFLLKTNFCIIMKGSGSFKQKIRDLIKPEIFFKNFRFIDDLRIFKNNEFENNYDNVYFDELELKNENKDPCKVSFLDLSIELHDKKFTADLFDKRDAFPIYINRIPWLDNNIPSQMFYASIDFEILHITRTTTYLINTVKRVGISLIQMKKQCSECTRITSLLKKIFGKRFKVFHKFSDTTAEFIKLFSL